MIIEQFNLWAQSNWATQLAESRVPSQVSEIDLNKLSTTLSTLRRGKDYATFSQQRVTGSVSQGWLDLNRHSPFFQESYDAVTISYPGSWTPADYLVHFAAKCKSSSDFTPPYDLGRALRNLPSFVREDSLLHTCQELGANVRRPPLEANFLDHADMYLEIKGTTYIIWSFIDTPKARRSVVHKLFNRGNDLKGFHVLAPINLHSDVQNILGWKIPSSSYASRLIDASDKHQSLDLHRTSTLARLGLHEDSGFVVLQSEIVNQVRN